MVFHHEQKAGVPVLRIGAFSPTFFVLQIEVYVIYKPWCKYKLNQATDDAVNLRLNIEVGFY